jgi:hypothetical protein
MKGNVVISHAWHDNVDIQRAEFSAHQMSWTRLTASMFNDVGAITGWNSRLGPRMVIL